MFNYFYIPQCILRQKTQHFFIFFFEQRKKIVFEQRKKRHRSNDPEIQKNPLFVSSQIMHKRPTRTIRWKPQIRVWDFETLVRRSQISSTPGALSSQAAAREGHSGQSDRFSLPPPLFRTSHFPSLTCGQQPPKFFAILKARMHLHHDVIQVFFFFLQPPFRFSNDNLFFFDFFPQASRVPFAVHVFFHFTSFLGGEIGTPVHQ